MERGGDGDPLLKHLYLNSERRVGGCWLGHLLVSLSISV